MKLFLSIIIACKRTILFSSLLLCASVTVAADDLPYYDSQEFTPRWLKQGSPALANFHKIPAFSFTDQSGNTITDKTLANKIYVAGFFFSTCPGICPAIRSKLNKVQQEFINDQNVKIIQHSIRPTSDTVEVLSQYAKDNGIINTKWHLLTGDKDKIYSLAKSAYFASEDLGNIQNTNDFLHTESLLLIDQNKHIRGIYNGLNRTSVSYLIADIKSLKGL